MTSSEVDMSDISMSSGYPHLTVTAERRHLAYECVLLYEVVTKRLAALDDIRQGLTSVSALGTTCLDFLARWPKLVARFVFILVHTVQLKCLMQIICLQHQWTEVY